MAEVSAVSGPSHDLVAAPGRSDPKSAMLTFATGWLAANRANAAGDEARPNSALVARDDGDPGRPARCQISPSAPELITCRTGERELGP